MMVQSRGKGLQEDLGIGHAPLERTTLYTVKIKIMIVKLTLSTQGHAPLERTTLYTVKIKIMIVKLTLSTQSGIISLESRTLVFIPLFKHPADQGVSKTSYRA